MSEDLIKVLVDYHSAPKRKKPSVDTGHFILLHKAKKCGDLPLNSLGLNLLCEGKGIKK